MDFTRVVVDNLFELVDYWVTFNEPHIFCMLTYCAGAWPGGHPDTLEAATSALPTGVFYQTMHWIAVAHSQAYDYIHEQSVLLNPIVGVAHHVSFMRPYGLFDVAAVSLANSLSLFPFMDNISHKMDFIGINYYGQEVICGKVDVECLACRVFECSGTCFGPFLTTGSGLMVMDRNLGLSQSIVSMILHGSHAPHTICSQRKNPVVTSSKITREDRNKAWYELQKAAREKKTRPFYRAVNKHGLMYAGGLDEPIWRAYIERDWRFGHYEMEGLQDPFCLFSRFMTRLLPLRRKNGEDLEEYNEPVYAN
ncbi:hypothetical protein L1987_80715 [Smallanthus sonchifolius]|uniref:Uncharacterized protein n=1 Tax=Smallanthus sonchifolius TaxID=185202 RepID=A0ACB8YSQ2_9ASTR|nr:hypothetical protein L1987_80715 [Smallanthus sonchifolius]